MFICESCKRQYHGTPYDIVFPIKIICIPCSIEAALANMSEQEVTSRIQSLFRDLQVTGQIEGEQ